MSTFQSTHSRHIPYSSLTFLWIGLFGWKELLQRSPITLNTLPILPQSFDANYLFKKFNRYWKLELMRMESGQEPSIWKALFKTTQFVLVYLTIVSLAYVFLSFASIFILIWLNGAIENVQQYNKQQLVCIASLLLICTVVLSVLRNTAEYGFNIIGMKFRILLTTAIYQRVLSMSHTQVQSLSVGNILTLVTSDLYKFDLFFNHMPSIILTPITIILITGITSIEFGWISIFTIVFFIIHLILQLSLVSAIYSMYKRALRYCDRRNNCMREFIEGFRLIKCFAWEYAAAKAIKRIRKREFLTILTHTFLNSLSLSWSISFPLLYIMASCLSIYVLTGGVLTSSRVFGLLAFMRLYRWQFYQLTIALSGLSEMCASVNRIKYILKHSVKKSVFLEKFDFGTEVPIQVNNVTAGRYNDNNIIEKSIQDVSIKLRRGDSLSVIGKVGAGKSSLLLALNSEIDIVSGDIKVFGSCAFVPQEPWILSTSIRDNITYGRQWNSEWYDQVVSACCLEVDLRQFREGDLTMVGERGITLSGGQKARISLARAVYFNADIYLLDDPLSSMDTEVAKGLFSIFSHGILSNKTVILVTHLIQFAIQTDYILLLDSGKQVAYGEYSEIQTIPAFKEYSLFISHTTVNRNNRVELIKEFDSLCSVDETEPSPLQTTTEYTERITRYDAVSLLVYAKYIWASRKALGIISLLFFPLVSYFLLIVGVNYYLVWWIESNSTTYSHSNLTHSSNPLLFLSPNQRVYIFVAICLLISILLVFANLTFSWLPVFSSYRLHETLLWRVLRAPSMFYYKHSSGNIINKFSKDTFTMDHILPFLYLHFSQHVCSILFAALSAVFTHWLTIVPNLILLLFLLLYRYLLVRTIRQIKRIESAAKSDVISHVSLSLHGLTTIHSLELEEHQNNKMCNLENFHSKCWRVFFAFTRSFSFQLDIIIAIYSLAVAIILIMLREHISPVLSAFALSQIFYLLDTSQYTLRLSAELEMHMVSVERVLDYINIPQEAPLTLTGSKFKVTHGDIEFRNVQLRYSPDLPLVLRDVSFRVSAGERLGIVGRTGAGKTALQTALLRLVEPSAGQITIDGVDIGSMGLHELRREISIIPQDPVLFRGPLRFSLDPFSSFRDEQLWQALGEVQMSDKIEQLDGQLGFSVSKGGSNFSVGERQLLCLARAILKQSRILMLEEATSNVDSITDMRIQRVLSTKLRDCTLLTIAHRIDSIVDYDKILLMDNGQVVGYDTPQNLLENRTLHLFN